MYIDNATAQTTARPCPEVYGSSAQGAVVKDATCAPATLNSTRATHTGSFSRLPTVVQADGYVIVPAKFVTENASVLTDRQFFTALGLLLELEDGPWESSPSSIAVVQGRDRRDVAKDFKAILRANLGLRLKNGIWSAEEFYTRYSKEGYTQFPKSWLLHLGLLGVELKHQRVLVVLYTLWNPVVDQHPFLSCRTAARALGIDQGPASLRLADLPSWVSREGGGTGTTARRYGLGGWFDRLATAVSGRERTADEPQLARTDQAGPHHPLRADPVRRIEVVQNVAVPAVGPGDAQAAKEHARKSTTSTETDAEDGLGFELDPQDHLLVAEFLRTEYRKNPKDMSYGLISGIERRFPKLTRRLRLDGDFDPGEALLDHQCFCAWLDPHYEREIILIKAVDPRRARCWRRLIRRRAIQRLKGCELTPLPECESREELFRREQRLQQLLRRALDENRRRWDQEGETPPALGLEFKSGEMPAST